MNTSINSAIIAASAEVSMIYVGGGQYEVQNLDRKRNIWWGGIPLDFWKARAERGCNIVRKALVKLGADEWDAVEFAERSQGTGTIRERVRAGVTALGLRK